MAWEADPATPLSAASLWARQREFFVTEGTRVWRDRIVPSYISTNPYLGSFLAEILAAYVVDVGRPVDIVELGSGSGRLAYHILRELGTRRPGTPYRYLATDLAPSVLDFWQQHHRLRPFVESGQLDFARFDVADPAPLQLTGSGEILGADCVDRPVAVIASYCFDSVPQDMFHVDGDGRLYECLVRVDPRAITTAGARDRSENWPDKAGIDYDVRPCDRPYYGDDDLDAVLGEMQKTVRQLTLPLPAAAIGSLRFFAERWTGGLLALIGDRGFTSGEGANPLSVVEPTRHGSVSFPVNFGAIGTWFKQRGGVAWHPPRPARSFNVSAFALPPATADLKATESVYRIAVETRDPDTFFILKKALEPCAEDLSVREALAVVRLGHWDPDILSTLFGHLLELLQQPVDAATRAELVLAVERVWQAYFPVGEDDLGFRLGALLYAVGEYRLALEFFERAQESSEGRSTEAWLNSAVCHQMLDQRAEAVDCVLHALVLAPDLEHAQDLLRELRQSA